VVLPDSTTMLFFNNQTVNVTGPISGTGAGLTPGGTGRVVLSGTNTYTGPTKVVDGDGDLVINGAQPASPVTINSGILEGTGTIGTLSVSAADQKVAVNSPGDPVGTMHVGNTNLGLNSVFGVEGTGAGFGQFDQLAVTGTVALQGDLAVILDFDPPPGTTFTIVDNDGTDAVTGTFAGLPEGAVFASGGSFFKVTYKGGTNNDVVITALAAPAVSVVTAPGSGGGPNIKSFGGRQLSFFAGAPGTGGASVAAGNVLGGQLDNIVVGSGAGIPSRVTVYNPDGSPSSTSFSPYGDAFTGGVNVGVADINGDGVDEIVTGAGQGGGPNVKVFTGDGTLVRSFFAYPAGFAGGVKVSGGDVTADGVDEIITGPGPGGGPNVKAFSGDGGTLWLSFNAYADNFGGGVNVAGADVDGDGRSEIVTGAGPGGGPHVRIFGGGVPMGGGFFAYPPAFVGGVFVGSIPNFGTQRDDIVTGAGPGGGPHVKTFSATGAEQSSFFAYDGAFFGGVRAVGALLNLPQ
jgi:autotransporter-associated beta strand protein